MEIISAEFLTASGGVLTTAGFTARWVWTQISERIRRVEERLEAERQRPEAMLRGQIDELRTEVGFTLIEA